MHHQKSVIQFIIIIITIFVASCAKDSKVSDNILPKLSEAVQLEGEKLSFTDEVFGIIYLKKLESSVIASTIQDDNLYWVLENGEVLAKFGNTGQGPNEVAYPIHIYDTYNGSAFLFDSQLLLLSEIDVAASMNSGKLEIIQSYEFPKDLMGGRDVFYINDALIVGIYDDHFSKKLDKKRGIFLYNTEENEYELLNLKNIEVVPFEEMPATNVNAKMPTLSPDRTKLAIVNVHNPLLEIVDLKTKQVKEYKLAGEEIRSQYLLEDFKDGEVVQYYTFAYSTDQYLYLLYKGYPEKEAGSQSDFIQVYTWDGKPVNHYEISSKYALSSFYVDERERSIIGHSLEYGQVYKFEY